MVYLRSIYFSPKAPIQEPPWAASMYRTISMCVCVPGHFGVMALSPQVHTDTVPGGSSCRGQSPGSNRSSYEQ